jgi:hypothetical protein
MHRATHPSVPVESPTRLSETRSIFALLAAPFAVDELAWRVDRSGVKDGKPWASVVAYINARTARKRLNEVMGQENWRIEYGSGPGTGVLASLSIRVNGEWITKQDGADTSDIAATKGGISASFKRAAAVWGVGEYLYGIGGAWAEFDARGSHSSKVDGRWFKWHPPQLAAQFLPEGGASARARPSRLEMAPDEQAHEARPETNSASSSRGNGDKHEPETASETMTLEKACAFLIPFGKMKRQPLGEMLPKHREDVKSGRDWAAAQHKFRDYVTAVDLLLAS